MSDFTLGVVNVWGGECLGGERLTIWKPTIDVDVDVDDVVEDVDSLQVVVDDNHDVRWQRDATHAAKSGSREARSQKTVSDSDNSLLRQLFR